MTKASKLLKMFKYWGLKETGTSFLQKFDFADRNKSETKYFAKSNKIKENWIRPENFDICFCVCFGVIKSVKILSFEVQWNELSTNIWFYRHSVVKHFAKTKTRKVWYLLSDKFERYFQKPNFGGETGH